jgi:Domain of unknown function (DUF4160)
MPRVMQADGYSFTIYYNDHPPPHVHVVLAGTRCKIAIGHPGTPPYLLDAQDMRRTAAGRALWMVNACQEVLLAHWRRIHEQNAD